MVTPPAAVKWWTRSRFLDDVLRRMDRHQHKKSAHLGSLGSWSEPQTL